MTTTSMSKPPVRVLRGLKVNEISLVDRGAGQGVRIVLMKRHEEPHPNGGTVIRAIPEQVEEPMLLPLLKAHAHQALAEYIELGIAKGMTRSAALDRFIGTNPQTWRLLKMGSHDLPQPSSVNGGGGRVPSPTHHSGHGGTPDPEHPHTEHHEGGDEALSRMRAAHAKKVYRKYSDGVRAHMASGKTASQAHDAMRREMSEEDWATVKTVKGLDASDVHVPGALHPNNPPVLNGPGLSPTMLPLSHDGNAGKARGPYQNMLGVGRPYR